MGGFGARGGLHTDRVGGGTGTNTGWSRSEEAGRPTKRTPRETGTSCSRI